MTDDDALLRQIEASQARVRRKLLTWAALAIVGVVALGLAIWLWPTGARSLEAERPLIERVHGQYCAVYETIQREQEARPPLSSPPSASLVLPGFHDLSYGDISARDPHTNTDGLEWADLATICDGQPHRPSVAFYSIFRQVDVIGTPLADTYDATGVELALEDVRQLEYVVVFVPASVLDSQVLDDETFAAGEMDGTAWLCRLEDAHCYGQIHVHSSGPHMATTFGGVSAELAVASETTTAFRHAVLFYLREAGVRIDEGHPEY
ncbi:MAG: hypothetical protein KC619_01020 [Myxococcales bacterium]|nr:hypothetical protein [Myxococcales bacterium]